MAMIRKANWNGTCVECKGEIKKGEMILSDNGIPRLLSRGIGAYEIRHLACPKQKPVETLVKNSGDEP
jgi:hypothetical protein